jgi:hypothetical protein
MEMLTINMGSVPIYSIYRRLDGICEYANDSGRDRKVQKIDHPSKE